MLLIVKKLIVYYIYVSHSWSFSSSIALIYMINTEIYSQSQSNKFDFMIPMDQKIKQIHVYFFQLNVIA